MSEAGIFLNKDFFNIPPSVIIFKKNDYAVAIDGYTKQKIIESTSHGSVLAEAVNQITDIGGKIFIQKGIYDIDEIIDLSGKKCITIEGESAGLGVNLYNNGVILRLQNNDGIFKIDNSSIGEPQNNPAAITFRNLQLDGNRQNGFSGDGFYLKWAGYVTIEKCHVYRFDGRGIYAEYNKSLRVQNCLFSGQTTANEHTSTAIENGIWIPNNVNIEINSGYVIWITHCSLGGAVSHGILLHNQAGKVLENIDIISNVITWNDEYGIKIERKSSATLWYINVIRNVIDENGKDGLNVTDAVGGSIWPLGLKVVANQFVSNSRSASGYYGLYLKGYDADNFIAGGEIIGNNMADPFGNGQNPLYIDNVDGIRAVGNAMNALPALGTNAKNVIIDDISAPQPYGGLPYYTSLPSSAFKGATIFYYDGSSYYIAVYDGSTWKKVQLT